MFLSASVHRRLDALQSSRLILLSNFASTASSDGLSFPLSDVVTLAGLIQADGRLDKDSHWKAGRSVTSIFSICGPVQSKSFEAVPSAGQSAL